MIIIDHPQYGVATEFDSVEEAEDALRSLDRGDGDWDSIRLRLRPCLHGPYEVVDERGQVVGHSLDECHCTNEECACGQYCNCDPVHCPCDECEL